MESRLVATARPAFRVFSGASRYQFQRRQLSEAMPTRRLADPAVHSEDPQGIDAEEAAKAASAEKKAENKPSKENEPFVAPKPPYEPSPKLESTGVNQPLDPTNQLKRRQTTSCTDSSQLEDVSCTGLDGTPWPEDTENRGSGADDKEYLEHHKASPLSEIEVADTRKPITKATDGTASESSVDYYSGGVGGVILWRKEQLDTAEDSLRRAMEIWRQSAMRGDPDSPHGRVLRTLRGENW